MLDVPTQQDRDWLLDRLAELIARCGHERFVSAPVIHGTTPYFPDAWRAEPAGVQVIARRLLWHTGLRDVRVRVRDTRSRMRPSTATMLSDTEVWFAEERNGVIELELAAVGNDDIIGILSHEVGMVFGALRGLDDHGGHPFRSPLTPLGDADDPSDEHRITVLGSPNQARDFRAWREQLGSERAALMERLGSPPPSTWPAPETVETVEPFDDEHYDDTDALDDEERKRFKSRPSRVSSAPPQHHAPRARYAARCRLDCHHRAHGGNDRGRGRGRGMHRGGARPGPKIAQGVLLGAGVPRTAGADRSRVSTLWRHGGWRDCASQ